jgi:serine/threonine protein kinase
MSAQPVPSSLVEQTDAAFADLVAEITDKLQAGQPVEMEQYVARHPEWADRLRDILPALEMMAQVSGGTGNDGEDQREEPLQGTLGDYRIVREIGRGGMAVVYEAEQVSLGRRVALKVLPFAATMDPRQLQRFHNEARAAASLHHEHIVPVHAVGWQRAVHFYAMQLIEGKSLAELIAARDSASWGQRPPEAAVETTGHGASPEGDAPAAAAPDTRPAAAAPTEAAPRDAAHFRCITGWGIQAAEALEYAHALGIVHRDIKPANLMLDGRGKLWVTDFGLARTVTDAGLTMSGDLLGTLRYMSPEQALARHGLVDHRTDVYSLGATLYELLTSQPAVEGQDRREILKQIADEEPRPPRALDRSIPEDLETIVLKALAKEPAERYTTARELADDLRRFLEYKPIGARRPTVAHRLLRWSKRHQAAMATTCLLLMLGVIGLAISSALIWREKKETEQALKGAKKEERLAQANADRARAQRERAEWNLNWSLNVTGDVLDKLGGEEFSEPMAILEVRRRLTAHAIRNLQGHMDEKNADPAIRQDTARICVAIALLYSSQADHGAARAALESGRDLLETLTTESSDSFRIWSELGHTRNYLAIELKSLGLMPKAAEEWRGAAKAFSQVVRIAPENARACNNLAWFLVTCPEPSVRDPAKAVELAKKAVAWSPRTGVLGTLLAWPSIGLGTGRPLSTP